MTKLLIKLFIKDADNTENAAVRSRYGVLSGAVGIACNLLLTIAKFLILMMGFELVRSSIDKIMHPEALSFSVPALIVLLLSIGVKIWMALFNHQLGKRIDSPAVGAVVMDSVSDTAATTVSMLALILSKFTSLPLDG